MIIILKFIIKLRMFIHLCKIDLRDMNINNDHKYPLRYLEE